MNVLLLSMPDYFEHMPPVAVRMPNGALTSLAGNVDDHHRVAVADLILSHRRVQETINRLFHEFDPEVVGLSVMTFQRRTAHRIIDLARALKRDVKIVVGGYDRSSNVAFYATTFPEQRLETIGVLGRTMHCSGSTRRLETRRRRCASQCCGKQLNRRCKRRSNPPGDLRPQRPHMFAPIPCR